MNTRRDMMKGGAALAVAFAMPVFAAGEAQKLRPQLPLGVAQTALGRYFRKQRGDDAGARGPADPIATVDYVRSLGAGGIQMVIPLDSEVRKLRAWLEHHKMFFEGDIRLIDQPGDDTAAFEKGLRMYKELDAPCVRTVCFVGRRYETFTTLQQYKDWKTNALAVLDVCVPIADKFGIPLAMENRTDRLADEEVEVLRKYCSSNFGALVDFGNNIAMCGEPMDVIVKLAPYVKSCHIKNMAVHNYSDGFLPWEVVFEDSFLDIPAMWGILKKSNPKLQPMHELITLDPLKVPVLTDKYWVTWPDRSSKYLADTIRLVNANASRKPLPVVSTLSPEAQFQAEDSNNIRCFDWARAALA